MDSSIRRAIAALTFGVDAQRHFDLAADRISRALLDVAIPSVPGIALGFRAEPSRLVGGDYLDLLRNDAGELVFCLGDASGKSLAAALNALMLRYLVRGLLTALGSRDLALLVRHANTVVTADVDDDSFVTFMCGVIDPRAGKLRIVNAGHEPALILRRDENRVEVTQEHGMVLGVNANATFREFELDVAPGDTIVLYTDGLTEATNERGELYTIERLRENILANRSRSPAELATTVFDTVKEYANNELRDDSTILVLRLTT